VLCQGARGFEFRVPEQNVGRAVAMQKAVPLRKSRAIGTKSQKIRYLEAGRFLVPLNSDYDLYSVGKDGASSPPIMAKPSQDDVIRASNGSYVGLAANF